MPVLRDAAARDRSHRRGRILAYLLATALVVAPTAPALASGEPREIAIRGTVTDTTGSPVAGAAVELHPEGRSYAENRRLLERGEGSPAVATARSGSDGRWRIVAPGDGFWRLRLTAPGFEPSWQSLSPLHRAATVDVVLSPARAGSPVSSRRSQAGEPAEWPALDLRRTGRPVEDALLIAGEARRPVGRAAASGRLRVPPEAHGEDLWIQTHDDRLTPLARELGSDHGGPLAIELPPSRPAAGRVRDARTGRPLAGALVWPAGEPWHGVRTAADGTFSVAASGPQVEALHVAASGFERADTPFPRPATPIDLLLQPTTALVGRVVDDRGRPVAGAGLRAQGGGTGPPPPAAAPVERVASGPDGSFELRLPGAGRYLLAVSRQGSVPPPLLAVVVADGQRLELGALRLPRGARLAGTVTDPGGVAVSEGRVAILTAGSATVLAATETAADGGFLFEGLPAGVSLDLRVTHPDYPAAWRRGLEVDLEGPLVEIVLESGATLAGRVEDGDGLPLSDAAVTGRLDPAPPSGTARTPLDEPILADATTDASGAFELRFPAAGHVELEAAASGYQTGRRVGIAVAESERTDEVVLVLEPAASLAGQVLQPDGEGAAGAEVTIVYEDSEGTVRSALADAEGRFALDAGAPGTVALLARKDGFGSAGTRLDLAVGENQARLVLGTGLEVRGTVTDAHGAPVAGALVSIQNAPPFRERAVDRSDRHGAFRLTGLSRGHHELRAERAGFAPARMAVAVGDTPPPPVVVRLEAGVRVRGRILGAAPGELAGAEVGALGPEGAVRSGRLEPAGGYTVDGLTAGTWTVAASLRGGNRQARKVIEIDAAEGERLVDLDLGEGPVLSGTVRLGGGALVAARVELVGTAGQGAAHGTTGSRGDFRLSGLVDGVYVLAVSDPDGTILHREPIEIAGSRHLELDLVATSVVGLVRDGGGLAVAGAAVSLAPAGAPERPSARARTDAEGRFVLARIPLGTWLLTVRVEGRPPVRRQIELSDAGPAGEVVLEMPD